jgi:hypothetical protein
MPFLYTTMGHLTNTPSESHGLPEGINNGADYWINGLLDCWLGARGDFMLIACHHSSTNPPSSRLR